MDELIETNPRNHHKMVHKDLLKRLLDRPFEKRVNLETSLKILKTHEDFFKSNLSEQNQKSLISKLKK